MQRLRYSADKNRKVRLSRFYSTVFYTADTAQSDFSDAIFYPQKTQRKSRRTSISSVFTHLRAQNAREEHARAHTRIRAREFSGAFFRTRDAEDVLCARVIAKTLSYFYCFSVYFFQRLCFFLSRREVKCLKKASQKRHQ